MTPRTRTTNKDANFKVYYSKKVPKQVQFPHKRKTVRRPDPAQDAPEPRQMTFLPAMMRKINTVQDSQDEDTEDSEDEVVQAEYSKVTGARQKKNDGIARGRKRNSDVVKEEEDNDDDPVQPTPKRRKRTSSARTPTIPTINVDIASADEWSARAEPVDSAQADTRSKRRRQSTMTQLVNGRRPLAGEQSPRFMRVKRTNSGGTKGEGGGKGKQQRTLTQMVPEWMSPGVNSDGDRDEDEIEHENSEDEEQDEEQDEDAHAYNESLAAHLEEGGSFQPARPREDVDEGDEEKELPNAPTARLALEIDADDEENEEEYLPTQFIDKPVSRVRRSSRRLSGGSPRAPTITNAAKGSPWVSGKPRFNLLSTPERRRIREIPSSQSPPDSPLSTRATPRTGQRPLTEFSGNTQKFHDTPSKRTRVTFQETVKEAIPLPLRRFQSTIQDSEGEDDDDDEIEELDHNRSTSENQAVNIGSETQALIDQIDQACAHVEQEVLLQDRELSEELGEPTLADAANKSSQEFGEARDVMGLDEEEDWHESQRLSKLSAHTGITKEQSDEEMSPVPLPVEDEPLPVLEEHHREEVATLPPSADDESLPVMQDQTISNFPSSPLIADNELEAEEVAPFTSIQQVRFVPESTPHHPQESADLDGELIQVPRSPAKCETQETIYSHSSKAEHQLQSEWAFFSQLGRLRAPLTSSMLPAQDSLTYQATPVNTTVHGIAPPQWSAPLSQATTVDERSPNVTPKKPRSMPPGTYTTPRASRIVSNHTTPHRVPSSQPVISPEKPPTLYIPSSFPTPGRARMADWSSPVLGRTQMEGMESLEDFSIPGLPPIELSDDEE
jgi:hypothetical protein